MSRNEWRVDIDLIDTADARLAEARLSCGHGPAVIGKGLAWRTERHGDSSPEDNWMAIACALRRLSDALLQSALAHPAAVVAAPRSREAREAREAKAS